MDVFNPPERQQIIPPLPPPQTSTNTSVNNSNPNYSSAASTTSGINANTISSTNNTSGNVTVTIDTKQMQSELERRQQELEIKAAELAAREEALRQGGGDFRRQHNWPPIPAFCPIKPCFFQDINIDIRPEFQRIVQQGYHLWIAFVFTQLLNIFAAIMLLIYKSDGKNLGYGIMTFVFCVPLTYMSWFRPLYKAFKNDSSFNFMIFFFVFFMQTLVAGVWSLGLVSEGPCGLFIAIGNLGTSILLTLVLFLTASVWIAYAAASILYIIKVHAIYRSSDASIAKARSEFTQGIISNQYVQQTVANAARTTVNQTFAAATSTNNNQPPLTGVR